MPRLLLGVSGGIAAYKALELVRLATAAGHAVRVIQTPASRRFVGAASFAALSGAPVLCGDLRARSAARGLPRRSAARPRPRRPSRAGRRCRRVPDRARVRQRRSRSSPMASPTTCYSASALAARCPLLLAPAMNDRMWGHPATRANVALLRERGAEILEPGDRPPRDGRRVGNGAPARAGRAARRSRSLPARADARRDARARDGRGNARADRRRALPGQPLLRSHGLRDRRRRGGARRAGCRRRRERRARAKPPGALHRRRHGG